MQSICSFTYNVSEEHLCFMNLTNNLKQSLSFLCWLSCSPEPAGRACWGLFQCAESSDIITPISRGYYTLERIFHLPICIYTRIIWVVTFSLIIIKTTVNKFVNISITKYFCKASYVLSPQFFFYIFVYKMEQHLRVKKN